MIELIGSIHLIMFVITFIYLNEKAKHLSFNKRFIIAAFWPVLVISVLFDVVKNGYKK